MAVESRVTVKQGSIQMGNTIRLHICICKSNTGSRTLLILVEVESHLGSRECLVLVIANKRMDSNVCMGRYFTLNRKERSGCPRPGFFPYLANNPDNNCSKKTKLLSWNRQFLILLMGLPPPRATPCTPLTTSYWQPVQGVDKMVRVWWPRGKHN